MNSETRVTLTLNTTIIKLLKWTASVCLVQAFAQKYANAVMLIQRAAFYP